MDQGALEKGLPPFFKKILSDIPQNHFFANIMPILAEIEHQKQYFHSADKIKALERLIQLIIYPSLCGKNNNELSTYGKIIAFWKKEKHVTTTGLQTALEIVQEKPATLDILKVFTSPEADGFLPELEKRYANTSLPKEPVEPQTQGQQFKKILQKFKEETLEGQQVNLVGNSRRP